MSDLDTLITAEAERDTFDAAKAFAAHLMAHYGQATAGVIFYGSCLRQKTDMGLLLDFYVLVDRYGPALRSLTSAGFARLLPPNVYYHEMDFEGRKLRAKVAVIAVGQFLHGVGPVSFASSLWARFAQPAAILYARNMTLRRRLTDGLASAVRTTMTNVQPLMSGAYTARDLWVRAFAETYRAELRPEKETKCIELVEADLARYEAITRAVLGDGPYQPATTRQQHSAARVWRWRRMQGKTLNFLRLIKAAFTFQGGLDYATWKIERHSGVKIELTEAERKRPLRTGARLLLKTVRRGGLR